MSHDGVRPIAGPRSTDPLADLRRGRIQGEEARLRAASQLLESFTYQELFKAMRDTIPEGGVLPGGAGKEIFESLLDQHIAQAAAMGSERGLGSALYRHFAKAVASLGPVESDSPHEGTADHDLVDGTV